MIAAAFALLAICLRLITPDLPVVPAAATGAAADLIALFGEHALCLAAAAEQESSPDAPTQPVPIHHEGICCPWHACPGYSLPVVAEITSASFNRAAPHFQAPRAVKPRTLTGIRGARGPPSQA